jgi:hypothetical protein
LTLFSISPTASTSWLSCGAYSASKGGRNNDDEWVTSQGPGPLGTLHLCNTSLQAAGGLLGVACISSCCTSSCS